MKNELYNRIRRTLIITGLVWLAASALAVDCFGASESYVVSSNGKSKIPLAYNVTENLMSFDLNPAMMDEPEDLCVGPDDSLYILDSGNRRIIKISDDRNHVKEIQPEGKWKLSSPEGIFVDRDGTIYVADTGNSRVLVMQQDGKVVNSLTQPTDPTYDRDYLFRPSKVGVDSLGQIYVINKKDYHGFCVLNKQNDFLGYFATNRVEKNEVLNWVSKFASSSQKQQMGKTTPPQHSNFCVTKDGSIYVTTINVSTAQIERLSSTGVNFYPYTGAFGEVTASNDDSETKKNPKFVDITADNDGILTALDSTTGKLYQYDASGVMLSVFGGEGSWRAHVLDGAAMAQDSHGNIYVLDKTTGSVQRFEPTGFTKSVHRALRYHNNGDYEKAKGIWQHILNTSHNYAPACIGMAKVLEKQGNYSEAMRYYRMADDREAYSEAFIRYQKEKVQEHFAWVILSVVLIVTLIGYMLSVLKKKAEFANQPDVIRLDGKSISLIVMFSPKDAFRLIKYDRSSFDMKTPTAILCFATVMNALRYNVFSYQTIGADPQNISLAANIFGFLIPFLLWCVGYYYVSCIFNGEVLLREAYVASCYALLPFAAFALPVALLSNILGISSNSLLNFLMVVIWGWVVLLVFIGVKTMNEISAKETIRMIIISILAAIFIALIMTFLYLLGARLLEFVNEVLGECRNMLIG